MNTMTKCMMTSLVFLTIALASPEMAQARPGQNGIVGAWVIVGQPDGGGPAFTNTGALHSDGTTSNSDPVFGPGNGVWERTGPRSYAVRFVTIVSPFNAVLPNTIITVNGTLTLDGSQEYASGDFETTFTDLNGNLVLPVATGTVELTRISID